MVLLRGACGGGGDQRHACVPCHRSVDGNVCHPLVYLKVKLNKQFQQKVITNHGGGVDLRGNGRVQLNKKKNIHLKTKKKVLKCQTYTSFVELCRRD